MPVRGEGVRIWYKFVGRSVDDSSASAPDVLLQGPWFPSICNVCLLINILFYIYYIYIYLLNPRVL